MTDPDDFRGGRPSEPRHKTQAYSFVDRPLPKPSSLATTQEMPAVMTMEQLIDELISVNPLAWKTLPKTMRDLMMKSPSKFHLDSSSPMKEGSVPEILYKGVVLRFSNSQWVLDDIIVE